MLLKTSHRKKLHTLLDVILFRISLTVSLSYNKPLHYSHTQYPNNFIKPWEKEDEFKVFYIKSVKRKSERYVFKLLMI